MAITEKEKKELVCMGIVLTICWTVLCMCLVRVYYRGYYRGYINNLKEKIELQSYQIETLEAQNTIIYDRDRRK